MEAGRRTEEPSPSPATCRGLPPLPLAQLILLTRLRGDHFQLLGDYDILNLGVAQFSEPERDTDSNYGGRRESRPRHFPYIDYVTPPAGRSPSGAMLYRLRVVPGSRGLPRLLS